MPAPRVLLPRRDNPQDLRATVSQFLYQMRISAKLQVVQLLEGEGLDAILPTRGARTWGGAKANKAIVSTQLGKLAFGSAVTEGNVEAPRHETQTYDAPVEKDDGLGVGGVSVEVVEDEASVGAEEGLGPKMRTSRAFNRVLRKYSEESALVMTNSAAARRRLAAENGAPRRPRRRRPACSSLPGRRTPTLSNALSSGRVNCRIFRAPL